MSHPYADLIGFKITRQAPGESRLELTLRSDLLNPHKVAHGAVCYALADTGMGAALYPMLDEGESCATINCSISYFKPVSSGTIICSSTVTNRGRSVATMESELWRDTDLVAKAHGQFSIFKRRQIVS